jgi:LmeA-like phospholipid-binding
MKNQLEKKAESPAEESPPKKSRAKKRFYKRWYFIIPVVVVLVLLGLWVASELIIPGVAESYAKREIKNKYPEATDVSVSIKAFPAIKLAFKNYDSLTVKVSGVTLQGVNFETIVLKSNAWPQGTFTATIGQNEIIRFFSLKNSWVIDPELSVEQDGILIAGSVDIGPRVVGISTRGTLEASGGKRVFFRPSEINVSDVIRQSEASSAVRQKMEATPVFVVREELPYTITAIAAEPGKLVIRGKVDLEKALHVKL